MQMMLSFFTLYFELLKALIKSLYLPKFERMERSDKSFFSSFKIVMHMKLGGKLFGSLFSFQALKALFFAHRKFSS